MKKGPENKLTHVLRLHHLTTLLIVIVDAYLLDDLDDSTPQFGRFDGYECFNQRKRLVEIGGDICGSVYRSVPRGEKFEWVNVEGDGGAKKARGGQTIETFFVFLDLLETHAEHLRQLLLREAFLYSCEPKARANQLVDLMN